MKKIRSLVFACTLIILGVYGNTAFARIDFDVELGTAPPPAYVEPAPVPRPGYIWSGGYWAWRYGQYAWIPGHWIEERPGFVWHPEHWEHKGEKWHLARGQWGRR